MATPLMLLSEQLQKPLEDLILPKLEAAYLSRLASSYSQMNTRLAAVSPCIWRAAAARVLYKGHPSLRAANSTAIRESLRSYVQSKRHIQLNKHNTLLDLPTARNLSISPSGFRLAMVSNEQSATGSENAYLKVYTADPTSSTLQLSFQIQLEPIHATRQLFMQLVWSPDDTKLTFLCSAANRLDCTVYDAATGQQLSILHLPHSNRPIQISPDGKLLAYRSEEEIAVYDLGGQTSHSWGHLVSLQTVWSPDSLSIAYTHVLEELENNISEVIHA